MKLLVGCHVIVAYMASSVLPLTDVSHSVGGPPGLTGVQQGEGVGFDR